MNTKNKNNGFTLVEIAIVIGIVGIIMVGMFSGMGALRETIKFKQDQRMLTDVKQALLTFVSVNGYLPCPDTTGNGLENRDPLQKNCINTSGNLPFIDLETHQTNAYGLPFSYIVNQEANTGNAFSASNSASFFSSGNCLDLDTVNNINAPCFKFSTPPIPTESGNGNYRIQSDLDANSPIIFADQIPLIVLSHGQNACPGESVFEQHNCSPNGNNGTFYQAQQQRNFFDDVMIWISAQEIKATLSSALASQRTPRRVEYDFAEMSIEEINEFIKSADVRYVAGRGGENAWTARDKAGMVDESGDSVDSLLSVNTANEQILLVPIPDDFEQYKISVKARLTQEQHGSNQIWNEGGFAVFFDTYLENDDPSLRNNSRIQKGYVYQFDRGHTNEFSRQLIRPWNLLDVANYNNAEQAVDFYYPRFPEPADTEPKTQDRIDYEYERQFVPDRNMDPDWWIQVYLTEIIVTGKDTDRQSNIRIVGWNDDGAGGGDWSRLVAQFDYPWPNATSVRNAVQTSKGVTIQHLIIDETKQLYTGLRTWNRSPTEFHYLVIEEVLD
ncbi:prepilin-type N-terminal cleavage/methylation domain-containing protein [Thiomicrospira microaerophila]|uniref:prepilin-type N-terminal cleavage/methylation domain-containing protein n=1 Tax=Thiomicrospira microaerophila TaxID=406020 RepID=UPI00200BF7A0|nr:prepilin-type N-terminal cleavage/methylation domain-containing protein [Thiomicrospira microaerophila]UQB41642.1 prepilin-type N-terminal cleavage/methylation domain-containing protein [Thiomicrospira microaerophila]